MSGRNAKSDRATATTEPPSRSRWHLVAGIGGALVVVVVAIILLTQAKEAPRGTAGATVHFAGSETCPASGAQPYNNGNAPNTDGTPVGQPIEEMPHAHVAPPAHVTYNHDPPTSGCHYSIAGQAPVSPGVYNNAIADEYWVHNLEHGYVVVLYNCPTPPGCALDVQRLKAWYDQLPLDPVLTSEKKVVVLPYSSMSPHFAVVSWDWYLPLDELEITKVQAFYDNHVDQSPESNQAP